MWLGLAQGAERHAAASASYLLSSSFLLSPLPLLPSAFFLLIIKYRERKCKHHFLMSLVNTPCQFPWGRQDFCEPFQGILVAMQMRFLLSVTNCDESAVSSSPQLPLTTESLKYSLKMIFVHVSQIFILTMVF